MQGAAAGCWVGPGIKVLVELSLLGMVVARLERVGLGLELLVTPR